jgi:hypothetical protein
MRWLIVLLGALAMALSACREWSEPTFETAYALPNTTLGDLRAYLVDNGDGGGAELTLADDITLAGRVVSSDREGNFYNTFFIDDGTGAAEIMAGMSDLDAVFHPGQRIFVKARGLAVGWRDGAMQLGLPPEPGNRYATGYFYHRTVIGQWVCAERDLATVEPLDVSLAGLDLSLCGRLVRIAGLEADGEHRLASQVGGGVSEETQAPTWATVSPQPATGYVKFRTSPTDSITVVTSGYASWAAGKVPQGEVSLTGILFFGRGGSSRDHFLLKLRDETDIGL